MSETVTCNAGHESPKATWNCPVCTWDYHELKPQIEKLKKELEDVKHKAILFLDRTKFAEAKADRLTSELNTLKEQHEITE